MQQSPPYTFSHWHWHWHWHWRGQAAVAVAATLFLIPFIVFKVFLVFLMDRSSLLFSSLLDGISQGTARRRLAAKWHTQSYTLLLPSFKSMDRRQSITIFNNKKKRRRALKKEEGKSPRRNWHFGVKGSRPSLSPSISLTLAAPRQWQAMAGIQILTVSIVNSNWKMLPLIKFLTIELGA